MARTRKADEDQPVNPASAEATAEAQDVTAAGDSQQPGGNTEKATGDAGQAEVQENFDEAEEQGYFGTGKEDKDRDALTVEGQAGATDQNDDDRAAANTGAGAGEPS